MKAPAGYNIYKPSKAFKAKPGDPVTVTVTNAKTATTPPPAEKATDKPSEKPSDKSSPDKPGKDEDTPAPSASGTPTSNETASPAPSGSLAHTGADATPWLIGGAGVLIVADARTTPPTTAPPRADPPTALRKAPGMHPLIPGALSWARVRCERRRGAARRTRVTLA
nr:hypothetical protein [Streptomyces sp. NBRC 110468]